MVGFCKNLDNVLYEKKTTEKQGARVLNQESLYQWKEDVAVVVSPTPSEFLNSVLAQRNEA